jgi:hypothetical protein
LRAVDRPLPPAWNIEACAPVPASVSTFLLARYPSDRVVLGVGNVQGVAVQGHALGIVEPRTVVAAVDKAFFAGANHIEDLAT